MPLRKEFEFFWIFLLSTFVWRSDLFGVQIYLFGPPRPMPLRKESNVTLVDFCELFRSD